MLTKVSAERIMLGVAVFRSLVLIAALLCPAAASAEWREAKTKHFIIYSEQDAKELREFAQELEQFDRGVRIMRGMEDPRLTDSGRLTIFVLRDQADVSEMANDDSGTVAGFYLGRASGPLAFVHSDGKSRNDGRLDAKTVFFHEYQHHLMLQSLDVALPLWVVEGSAEFFATAQLEDDGSLVFGAPPQYRGFGLYELDALSIEEMVGMTEERLNAAEREQVYGRGWLLVHMLVFDPSRKGQLNTYITNMQRGMPALAAGRAAFGDLGKLDRDLDRYRDRRKFSGFAVPKSGSAASDVAIRVLSEAESEILPVVMQSERGVNSRSAPRVLDQARRVAARFPNSPKVLAALAEAEQDAGNNAQAVAAADRALAIAPNLGKAMIMKARALLDMGRDDRSKADWEGLRALIGKVNRIDPDDAEPLMLFYQSYQAEGIAPTPNAVEGLLYAQKLVPQDDRLRMLAVQQMIRDDKLTAAERLFGPIAYGPHASGETREALRKVMAALRSRNGKEATSLLEIEKKKAESED